MSIHDRAHFRRVELTDEKLKSRYEKIKDGLGFTDEQMQKHFPNLYKAMNKK